MVSWRVVDFTVCHPYNEMSEVFLSIVTISYVQYSLSTWSF